MNKDTYVIIPVYNEASVIKGVIKNVSSRFTHIVCVDDGSSDKSSAEIKETNAILVKHPINLGQGASLQTGIEYALRDPGARFFVTFDADGQHNIADVEKMLEYIRSHDVDIVLGSRFLGDSNVGGVKKYVLRLAILFSNFTTGLKLTDAHNGLRVFNRHTAKNLNITMPDMAHASEIIHRVAEKKLKYVELPVTITYSDYSRAKGQSILNAINITIDLLAHRVNKR